MLVGYARVSTTEQSLALQQDALAAAGCDRVYTDVASGALDERPGLGDALDYVRKGDTLVVWRLDRLTRRGRTRACRSHAGRVRVAARTGRRSSFNPHPTLSLIGPQPGGTSKAELQSVTEPLGGTQCHLI